MRFDADYFERGAELGLSLYHQYRWLPELTLPMAHELISALGIRRTDRILDFGCAKGFLVKALRLLRHDAWGVDISEYALEQAPEEARPFLFASIPPCKRFDWVISKDVLEHIPHEQLPGVLADICNCTVRAFITVPLGDGAKYNAAEYERDVTHVIREDEAWWGRRFRQAGLIVELATTEMPFVKAPRCKNSDGFFILRSSVW